MMKHFIFVLVLAGSFNVYALEEAFYQQDWFVIYLAGCVAWVVFAIFKVLLILFLSWITKGNILRKNMAKISEPVSTSWAIRWGIQGVLYLIEAALSWLGVIINIGHLIVILFRILREVFTTVPEEIKRLNFPLLNNPNLSREAVWAHMYALGIKAGDNDPTDKGLMSDSLTDVSYYYSDFKRKKALKRLGTLNVVSDKVISSMLKNERNQNEDSTWGGDL